MNLILLLIQIGFLAICYILHRRVSELERQRIVDLLAIHKALDTMRQIEVHQNKWLTNVSAEIVKHGKELKEYKNIGVIQ